MTWDNAVAFHWAKQRYALLPTSPTPQELKGSVKTDGPFHGQMDFDCGCYQSYLLINRMLVECNVTIIFFIHI